MKESEALKLLTVVMASYPTFKGDNLTAQAQVWRDMLDDIPFELAKEAVKRHIIGSHFPPSIHDIRKNVAELASPPEIDAAEAWGEVIKAVRYFGIYSEKEAMESLTPRTRKVVTWMGWREICMSEEVGVTRGQFLKMYGQVQERDKQDALLPEGLKKLVGGMKQIGGGRT